jgi:hypothetical protein
MFSADNSTLTLFIIISQLQHLFVYLRNFNKLILMILGYHHFIVKNKESRIQIMTHIKEYKIFSTLKNENLEPVGLLFHWSLFPKFIVYGEGDYHFGMNIICSPKFMKEITQRKPKSEIIKLDENFIPVSSDLEHDDDDSDTEEENEGEKEKHMLYVSKFGDYGYFQYKKRIIDLYDIHGRDDMAFFSYQNDLFKDIMGFYKSHNHCKVFLSGEMGSGKTFFTYLMSQKLGCFLCDKFNPYEPSSNFSELYNSIRVRPDCPLILVLDEVDVLIKKIHCCTENEHIKYSREITNKMAWNSFMDKISFGIYPYTILFLISNEKKVNIDNLDKSYLRKGRIDINAHW